MILQALTDYYKRKSADPDAPLAPPGFEYKAIPFVIVIDPDGRFVELEDTREKRGKKWVARQFLVPKGVKKTSGVAANLLWDTAEYVLGIDTRGKPERVAEQHHAFLKRLNVLKDVDAGVAGVCRFLELSPVVDIEGQPAWQEVKETNPLMTLRLRGESELICQSEPVQRAVAAIEAGDSDQGLCLVSGARDPIERLHPAIKGVRGAQSSGANIVSFNLDAFTSYGKQQGHNAPVGTNAAFAYTTALNHLLRSDSSQRLQVGDATVVFWAARQVALENDFQFFFSDVGKDDPDARTRLVRSLFSSIHNGAYQAEDKDVGFHILGLAPNNARIAVRFWHSGTVGQFAERIAAYFEDLDIAGREKYGFPSLFRLLLATAALRKADNINPLLAGSTLRAILEGLPLPEAMLQNVIRRLHSEREVTYERAALIKGCLNRKIRTQRYNYKELTVALDPHNTDPGYRLGRLFAVLERIQEAANPGLNATIRDRFYSAASSAPVTVFANLLRLSNHHLGKLSTGQRIYYEKLLGDVMDEVPSFPAHLRIEEQGQFAIGYYHQRQALFQKREEQPEQEEAITE